MDPVATSPTAPRAGLCSREHGVDVVVAQTVADAERAAGPDTLLLAAEIYQARTGQLLDRLSDLPGDRLVLEPRRGPVDAGPGIRISTEDIPTDDPGCDPPEAKRAGVVAPSARPTPTRRVGDTALTLLRRGAGAHRVRRAHHHRSRQRRFHDQRLAAERGQRRAGDLAGNRSRLIWYAPQQPEVSPPTPDLRSGSRTRWCRSYGNCAWSCCSWRSGRAGDWVRWSPRDSRWWCAPRETVGAAPSCTVRGVPGPRRAGAADRPPCSGFRLGWGWVRMPIRPRWWRRWAGAYAGGKPDRAVHPVRSAADHRQ